MRKMLLIILWITMLDSGQPTDWYVEIENSDGVTIKVARDLYLEHQSFMEINTKNRDNVNTRVQLIKDIEAYKQWEYYDKYKEADTRISEATGYDI